LIFERTNGGEDMAADRAPFVTGKLYHRRSEVHGILRGQRRGGIATPQGPFVLLFTGESGRAHGYVDGWSTDGLYRYFGEGRKGDMKLIRGNKAVAEHVQRGKSLLLFHTEKKGHVRYMGEFVCSGYQTERAPDADGK
jgi:5-methylcytosine-specific restriction protein A